MPAPAASVAAAARPLRPAVAYHRSQPRRPSRRRRRPRPIARRRPPNRPTAESAQHAEAARAQARRARRARRPPARRRPSPHRPSPRRRAAACTFETRGKVVSAIRRARRTGARLPAGDCGGRPRRRRRSATTESWTRRRAASAAIRTGASSCSPSCMPRPTIRRTSTIRGAVSNRTAVRTEAVTRFREYLRKATAASADERAQLEKHIAELDSENHAPATRPCAVAGGRACRPATRLGGAHARRGRVAGARAII